MQKNLAGEEIALRITGIYFEEIVRRGAKRRLDFDAMINTYFYVLEKMKNKDELLCSMKGKVVQEEAKLLDQSENEIIPRLEELKEKIPRKEDL